jgi:MFS family permease
MTKPLDEMSQKRRNLRFHYIEGSLYMASLGILNVQTVYPSLVRRLGGSDIAIGLLPVIAFGVYLLPQILGANYASRDPLRRAFVLRLGLLQRLMILLLGVSVALLGAGIPSLALTVFFVAFTVTQILSGLVAPAWFDFLTKTIPPGMRGRLLGLRSSTGGLLSVLSSLLLTAAFAHLPFPESYALVFAVAFLWQISSWFVLRKVVETEPSHVQAPLPLIALAAKIRGILAAHASYRRFLVASALSTIGLMGAAFFMVAALEQSALEDSAVGLFTTIAVGSQVVSALALGWLGDRFGYRSPLLVCSGAMVAATALALVAQGLWTWYPVFALTGITVGAEMVSRFNFAVDCAPDHERALFVGVLNAWLAPWYLTNIAAGWIGESFGYGPLFVIGVTFAVAGFVALARVKDPRRDQTTNSLALSSK